MIAVEDVSKSYGSKTVLSGVSTSFPAGGLTSLIGPNGAGKTTLLMAIARLSAIDRGRISLNGRDITAFRIGDYAKRVATLRQSNAIDLRIRVEDLVAFGRFPYSRGALTAEDREAIDDAIGFLSLADIRGAYIDTLSGGQRQMAFLAMTIAQQTDCLLLDEPLNNLDMKHAVQIMRALRRLCDDRRCTIVLVIHHINFAANYSDRIVAMKKGVLHTEGAVTDVVTEPVLSDLFEIDVEITQSGHGRLCNYFRPTRGST